MENDLGLLLDTIPGLAWTALPDGRAEYVGKPWLEYTGLAFDDTIGAGWIEAVHPDDRPRLLSRWTEIITSGQLGEVEARLRRHDGVYRWFLFRACPMPSPSGDITRWCGINFDIDDRVQAEAAVRRSEGIAIERAQADAALKASEAVLASEKQLLERVAKGVTLPVVLDELARAVEALVPGCYCTILIVDESREHFKLGAAPTLPEGYRTLLDGKPIEPDYGPLSRCIFEKAPIIVADARIDPRWAASAWPGRMAAHGLRSSWTAPILAANGGALAAFAIYRREPAMPTPHELELIDRFTHIAGIAMERAQADAALEASEAEVRRTLKYMTLAQQLSHTGSHARDVASDEQVLSEEMYRILEFDPQAPVTHEMVLDRIHPEDRQATVDAQAAAQAAGVDYEFSYRMVMPSGAVKHLRTFSQRQTDLPDRLVYVGATQDVTDWKLAEEAVAAGQDELRRTLQYMNHAQRLSQTGSFARVPGQEPRTPSEEIYRIYEFGREERITNARILERVHPDDRALVAEARAASEATGDGFNIAFRIITPSGGLKYLRTFTQSYTDSAGEVVHVGATQDVTDWKLAEEALQASRTELLQAHAHLNEAQQLSRTGSFTWDVERDEHNWSAEERRIWEFGLDAKITMPMILETIHPDDMPLAEQVIGGALHQDRFETALRIITKSGLLKHVHIVGRRVEDVTDRIVFLGAVQDITERKNAEEALNRARAELAHVSRAMTLSALTASIAHEVNQPLAGIITNATTGLRMLAANPPNLDGVRSTLQRTLRDGNRASEVIQRLRAMFARQSPGLECVDLNDAAREVLAISAGELQQRRVMVSIDFTEDLPAISGDRVQLQQVILNLVLNAADAMCDIEDRPRNLRLETAREGTSHVRLSVEDSGVGVEAEKLEQLFHAFFTTKPQGMGIGLAISRTIIENHEGQLWAAQNADGPGATFSFCIPTERTPAAQPDSDRCPEVTTVVE